MDLKLDGKIVLITGGAKGIGAEIARALIDERAIPVIIDKDATAGSELECELLRKGGKAKFIACELSTPEAAQNAVDDVVEVFGGIHALVNNAGVNDRVGLESGSPSQFV